jgi:hypothetical protein
MSSSFYHPNTPTEIKEAKVTFTGSKPKNIRNADKEHRDFT